MEIRLSEPYSCLPCGFERPAVSSALHSWLTDRSRQALGHGLSPSPCGAARGPHSPRSMFCWCLAVQISRLMPSMHWLLDSTSLSFVFLGKNITVKRRAPLLVYCSFRPTSASPNSSRMVEWQPRGRSWPLLTWDSASCCDHIQHHPACYSI